MSCIKKFIPIPGPVGPTGTFASSNTGATGPTGKDGAVGPTGEDGAVGPTGKDGAVGPTGNDGAIGPTGKDGASSSTGTTGPTGKDGAVGPTGKDGASSSTGATGPTGAVGPTGPSNSQISNNFKWKVAYMGYDNNETIDVQILNALYYGFNLIILAFWLPSTNAKDPFSALDKWSQLNLTMKTFILNTAHTLGAKIILSAGGATESPYTLNATTVATNACNYAIAQQLDGVD
jgi:hypothetical protein